jgi:hypothetical protein
VANSSLTSPNAPAPAAGRIELRDRSSAALSNVRALEDHVLRGLPFAQFEYVDATFSATAGAATDIRHSLRARDPADVRAIVVEWRFATPPLAAPVIWKATTRTAGAGYIVLACNVASANARLLLFLEPDR